MVGRRGLNPPGPVGGVGAGNPPGLVGGVGRGPNLWAGWRCRRWESARHGGRGGPWAESPWSRRRCGPRAESPWPGRRRRPPQRRRAAALAGAAHAVSYSSATSSDRQPASIGLPVCGLDRRAAAASGQLHHRDLAMIDPQAKPAAYIKLLAFVALLGVSCALVTFVFMALVQQGTALIWEQAAAMLGVDPRLFTIVVCTSGGLLVGLLVKLFGDHSGIFAEVMLEFGKTGRFDYRNAPGIVITAFVSLIAGASLGPEAPLADACGGMGTLVRRQAQARRAGARARWATRASAACSPPLSRPRWRRHPGHWNRRRAERAASRPISGCCSPAWSPRPWPPSSSSC